MICAEQSKKTKKRCSKPCKTGICKKHAVIVPPPPIKLSKKMEQSWANLVRNY